MLDFRTNVLWEKSDYQQLREMSRMEGVTVGELVRKAVKQVYRLDKNEAVYRKQLVADIQKLRKKVGVMKGKVDYKAWVNEGRKY